MKNLFSFINKQKNIIATLFLVLIPCVLLLISYFLNNNKPISEETSFVTNKGNVINMEYKDLGEFSIKIPKDFKIMDKKTLQIKYPSGNRPKLVYTNDDTSINIAFNLDGIKLNGKDLSEYVDSVTAMFKQMGYFPYSFNYELNGTKFYTISLTTQAIDTNIYNYMVIFSIDDQVKMISFNCIYEYEDEWNDVSKDIIQSIRVK